MLNILIQFYNVLLIATFHFQKGISTLCQTYGRLDNVSIVTLAPEKANAFDVIEELSKSNITVAMGHSVANFTEGETAVKRGSNLITHLFNAMLPVSRFSHGKQIFADIDFE